MVNGGYARTPIPEPLVNCHTTSPTLQRVNTLVLGKEDEELAIEKIKNGKGVSINASTGKRNYLQIPYSFFYFSVCEDINNTRNAEF